MTNISIPNDDVADAALRYNPETFWRQFRPGTMAVNGVRLHYVEGEGMEGGSGPPVLLLPGWPQSWYAWRLVMPMLAAAGRRVVALDPRGIGDSGRPADGYDMQTVAADVHGFIEALDLIDNGAIDVVGHDLGTWIGYAHAANWPGDVRRLAVMDAALPGITPPPAIPSAEANLKTWHFAFNRLPDLPEVLIPGREREFLTWLFATKSVKGWRIDAAAVDEYVRVLAAPGALRAALAYYRAAFSPDGLSEAQARAERTLGIPVLALGAESGVGDMLLETMRLVATDVHGGTLADCGHYMPEERPATVAGALLRFLSNDAIPETRTP